ncbi:MAG: hypothetical protein SFV32_02720 [Opitutaceae bacterium]|nr:hypothetical protein [Opitutaceae bacterium]
MARIRLTYIGAGSTRAPGTIGSIIRHGKAFAGSEVVLWDLVPERLAIVKTIAERMAAAEGVDMKFTVAKSQREALQGADAVLSSYRPGGFEARRIDERIPRDMGVIGQETQGPGGFFMALRAIHVMQSIVKDMEEVCPQAWLVNYTNPINIVSQAVTMNSRVKMVSLCEGPIIYPRGLMEYVGLDPNKLDSLSIGINHASWSVRHLYDGADVIPLLKRILEEDRPRKADHPWAAESEMALRMAVTFESLPSYYFQYYYFLEESLAKLKKKPTTRSEDILAEMPGYWAHYQEQAKSERPVLDPALSRGGIFELELAIDVIDSIFNNLGKLLPVNVVNRGVLDQFPAELVVEVPGIVDRSGIHPLQQPRLKESQLELVSALAFYQMAAAKVAWSGSWKEAIGVLASHPLLRSLPKAESLYRAMAAAHAPYLPSRLVP